MPLWGIALAIGPNYNLDVDAEREKQAFEAIQKAAELAENSPQVERDYYRLQLVFRATPTPITKSSRAGTPTR